MTEKPDVREFLHRLDASLAREPECPYHLVRRGMAIQVLDDADGPSLQEAESSLLKAHELDPTLLDALEELAHFYDAVNPDRQKAAHYATLCRDAAAKLLRDMEEILQDLPEAEP